MNKISLALLTALTLTTTQAEYVIKKPLEQFNGGSLPNGSILFVTQEEGPPLPPAEIEDELSGYKGIGTLDTVSVSGFLMSSTFQNPMYSNVLFRAYGDHSIYLIGNLQELLNTAKSIVLTINGDIQPCEIYDTMYLA
ncbi:hypothetical protein [Pseudomonas asiatica]|uniref:hypothetical protein n=1 Tax=Pseudomonas asiatica TaxID=2219225 RepID=UPI0025A3EF67|nr:hypothetical protein [Pseudomonas asiatica]WJN48850.1 hypothetical protein QUR91_19675 [Pseudomonas asiatica]